MSRRRRPDPAGVAHRGRAAVVTVTRGLGASRGRRAAHRGRTVHSLSNPRRGRLTTTFSGAVLVLLLYRVRRDSRDRGERCQVFVQEPYSRCIVGRCSQHSPPRRPAVSEPGYLRIGELARRTGEPGLLRGWERRYGLLRPTRSQGGFRFYTAADEERIHRMKEYLARGVAAAGRPGSRSAPSLPSQTPSPPLRGPGRRDDGGCPPAAPDGHPRADRGAGPVRRSRPTPCWIDCSPPTASRPSCVICWSPTSTTWASAGRAGRSLSPRSTLPPTYCEAGCSHWPAAGAEGTPTAVFDLPAQRAARPRADRLWHHPVPAGLAHHLPGAGHPDRHHPPSRREHRARSGRPAAGTVPEPFADHSDAIADLARHTTLALGGAGAAGAGHPDGRACSNSR